MDKLRQIAGVLLFWIAAACGGQTSNETKGEYASLDRLRQSLGRDDVDRAD